MSNPHKYGGPAFPSNELQQEFAALTAGIHNQHPGMSLRDYFAAKAMQGLAVTTANGSIGDSFFAEAARRAYGIADAMLRAREI